MERNEPEGPLFSGTLKDGKLLRLTSNLQKLEANSNFPRNAYLVTHESCLRLGFRSDSRAASWTVTIPRAEFASYSARGEEVCWFEFRMLPLALVEEPVQPLLVLSENTLRLEHHFEDTHKVQSIDLLELEPGCRAPLVECSEDALFECTVKDVEGLRVLGVLMKELKAKQVAVSLRERPAEELEFVMDEGTSRSSICVPVAKESLLLEEPQLYGWPTLQLLTDMALLFCRATPLRLRFFPKCLVAEWRWLGLDFQVQVSRLACE